MNRTFLRRQHTPALARAITGVIVAARIASVVACGLVPASAARAAPDVERRPRIVLHTLDTGDSLPDSLEYILEGVQSASFDTRFVELAIDSDQVRYFHAEDALLAREIAGRLDGIFERVLVRDFSGYRPTPDPGLIELWVR